MALSKNCKPSIRGVNAEWEYYVQVASSAGSREVMVMRLDGAYLSPWPSVLLPLSLVALRHSLAEQLVAIHHFRRWKMR
jgi:hypothetical protein